MTPQMKKYQEWLMSQPTTWRKLFCAGAIKYRESLPAETAAEQERHSTAIRFYNKIMKRG